MRQCSTQHVAPDEATSCLPSVSSKWVLLFYSYAFRISSYIQAQTNLSVIFSSLPRAFYITRQPYSPYRGGIYDQQDATNSQYLLIEMLYMFRAIIAHHRELGTVRAAVRCISCEVLSSFGYIPGMVLRWWYSAVCSGARIWSLGEAVYQLWVCDGVFYRQVRVYRHTKLDTHTIRYSQSVALLWTSEELVTEAVTDTTYNKHQKPIFMPPSKFETTISSITGKQNCALKRTSTGIGSFSSYVKILSRSSSRTPRPCVLNLKWETNLAN
jgi:hypothetical protein